MAPDMRRDLFLYAPFCAYLKHDPKTTGRALLWEISILWVRAICEIWSASYGSKHACMATSSDTTFCAYLLTLITRKLHVVHMDILHIEWLLYYRRCLLSVLELDAKYDWWVMASKRIAVRSYKPFVHIYLQAKLEHIERLLYCRTLLVWFRVKGGLDLPMLFLRKNS